MACNNRMPLLMSKKQYDRLWSHLNADKKKAEMSKQEEEYREFLRLTSKEMTEKWDNTFEKSRLKKREEGKLMKQKALSKDEEDVKKLNKMDEARRNEIVSKAERLIQKSKIGPRSLASAALLSEVLQERQFQIEFQKKQRHELSQVEKEQARNILDQAKLWVQMTTKRHTEKRQRNDAHKLHVRDLAEEKMRERQQKHKQQIHEERTQNKMAFEEAEEQRRQKLELEKQKKADCRQNLVEAIAINEDKRRRQRAEKLVQDAMIDSYVLGKKDFVTNKRTKKDQMLENAEKVKKVVAERYLETQKEIEAKINQDYLALFKSKRGADMEIIEKREKERGEQAERIRQMRLQQQTELEEKVKQDRDKVIEEIQKEAAVLCHNNKVTIAYQKQKVEETKNKCKEVIKVLDAQLQEKEDEIRRHRRADIKLRTMNLNEHFEDDKNFYIYANNLLKDAKAKGRSTMQIKRAVDAYQRNNLLKYKDKDNRDFLFSKVPIGLTEDDRPPLDKPEDLIGKHDLKELEDLKPDQKY